MLKYLGTNFDIMDTSNKTDTALALFRHESESLRFAFYEAYLRWVHTPFNAMFYINSEREAAWENYCLARKAFLGV